MDCRSLAVQPGTVQRMAPSLTLPHLRWERGLPPLRVRHPLPRSGGGLGRGQPLTPGRLLRT
ncbi:hypothetical protein [Azospirillum largimobile]